MMQPRDFSPAELLVSDIGPGTVRLSIGLEDPLDLQTDLSRSLELAAR
jgi:cystathionine beta-lyase/cystathionine gamma-synthase